MRDETPKFYFIEINTPPGMTDQKHGGHGRRAGRAGISKSCVWRRAGDEFRTDPTMTLHKVFARTRFKKPAKVEKTGPGNGPWCCAECAATPSTACWCSSRRHPGPALTWAIERPIAVIS